MATLGLPPGMTTTPRALPGLPPGMLALSTGLEGGSGEGRDAQAGFSAYDPLYHCGATSPNGRRCTLEPGHSSFEHVAHSPGGFIREAWRPEESRPVLENRPAHGYRFPEDYEVLDEGPFPDYADAVNFRANELHPELERTSMIVGERGGNYSIHVPRTLRQQILGSGQQDVLVPSHAARAPAEPDYHDPAYPKIMAWHNDIGYYVPVHPQALSKEHMQALADYEVHGRQHDKLVQQLHGEYDVHGDRPNVVSPEAERRLDRSQQQLNHLRDLAQGAGHAAVGPIIDTHKLVKKKFYQAVRQGETREYRGQVLPDREAAIESMYPERRSNRQGQLPSDMKVEEFPGIWTLVNRHGYPMDSGISSHPLHQGFGNATLQDPLMRARILADAKNKELSVYHMRHRFGDPPEIDMTQLPIRTYGKTRKKTAEWFSNQGNLPPGMLAMAGEPLELAATEMVDQPEWEPSDDEKHPQGIIKDIPLGGTDRIRISANPYMHLDESTESARNKHGMAYPHSIGFTRHDGPDDPGTDEIIGRGKAGKILSHASMAIAELLHANPPPMSLHFAARGKSRNRAYRHLMQRAVDSGLGNGKYEFIEQVLDEPDLHAYHIIHHKIKKLPQYKNPLDVMQSESPIGGPLRLSGTEPVEQDDAYFIFVHKSVADQPVYHGMQTVEFGADSAPQPSSDMPTGMLNLAKAPSAGM